VHQVAFVPRVPSWVTIVEPFYVPPTRSDKRRLTRRAFWPPSQIFDCGLEDLPERAGISPPNAVWYPLSLRTDSVNRGISISFLTLARVVLAVSSGIFLFFIIPNIDTHRLQSLF
jgi:hypothetical protein